MILTCFSVTVYDGTINTKLLNWKLDPRTKVKTSAISSNISYLPESLNLLEASFLVHRAPFFRPKCLPL